MEKFSIEEIEKILSASISIEHLPFAKDLDLDVSVKSFLAFLERKRKTYLKFGMEEDLEILLKLLPNSYAI